MSCSICRKYVRLPNRPQVKIGAGAGIFNFRVQADLFEYKKMWILLIIDEATRFKAATSLMSKDFAEITRKMVEHWFTVYGAPMQLVMDQETGMMSHEAGRELERFGIERVPKGTTAGEAGKQHTGTGLVERHVGLLELTMQKLEAELDRQGISISPHELAKECAMAHNQSLNYNGATPSMAVFGVLPRPFYQEDNESVMAVAGALQTDITPFDRALRIRQTSLSMVQRAVAEDRVARANRSRPHQLRLGELVPGTTLVDHYREVNGDIGWRGPAELLKVSREEGTAILSYQGRPYLVSLRHIRPHQAGVFVTLSQVQEGDFNYLRCLVEKISLYKVMTVGWIVERKEGATMWRRSATSSLSYQETWGHIVSVESVARALSRRAVGGALFNMFGQSIRSFVPPKGTIGVLLYWKLGEAGLNFHEHTSDQVIVMKKITTESVERTAMIYVYYYAFPEYEAKKDMSVLPPEGYDDPDVPMDGDGGTPMSLGESTPTSTTSPTTSSPEPSSPQPMDEEEEPSRGEKRKGPETRTVTLAPETKRSKLEELLALMRDNHVHTSAQHNLINLYWVMRWSQAVPTEYPDIWQSYENSVYMAQWDIFMSRQSDRVASSSSTSHQYLFQWSGKTNCELRACLHSGEIYKVDDETDNLTEEECYPIWEQVEQADEDEIKQFVDTRSFEKVHRNALTSDVIIIDAVWVRKWKRLPSGGRKVKSRLCARGCFDKQKDLLSARSTTATRLSQRILMSSAAVYDLDCESWDISGAFLKGLSFEKVREMLRAKGVRTPIRKVAVIVPANVWRHLGKFDPQFRIDVTTLGEYVLLCLKPVYGLSDAPLAWQLCLHAHFAEQKGQASLMDENYFYWRDKNDCYSSGVTTHVDDCGAVGRKKWLDEQYNLLVSKFGKVTRQKLPFMHCGVLYSRVGDSLRMSQDEFCSKLKPAAIAQGRKDSDELTPQELTSFRSVLGGLLWLTATRLDLVSDVCLLQSQVTRARIEHLKQANNVVKKAKAELGQNLGIVFQRLRPPLRLACVHDSSAAGNVRNYAQEGVLVLLCEDHLTEFSREEEHVMLDYQTKLLGGRAHILWAHGAKSKRISYSTSHAETLAAISGLEASTLVAVRLAELMYLPGKPSLQQLIAAQEQRIHQLPVDDYTDCRDFFELSSGDKSVSQDKNQRLYILAFREARMTGRIRWLILCPTESMTADALTKAMVSPDLMKLLSSGTVEFYNQGEHRMTLRSLPRLPVVSEKHFDMHDRDLIREVSTLAAATYMATMKTRSLWLAMFALSATTPAWASTTTFRDYQFFEHYGGHFMGRLALVLYSGGCHRCDGADAVAVHQALVETFDERAILDQLFRNGIHVCTDAYGHR